MIKHIITELYDADIDELKTRIIQGDTICLLFPLTSIGSTNNHIDICQDYLRTSFCCEKIASYINIQHVVIAQRDIYYKDYKIQFTVSKLELFIKELNYISEMLSEELNEYDDLDVISFYDEMSEYEGMLSKIKFTFPELIDQYWANMINGAYFEIANEYYDSEEQFLSKVYRKNPEHRLGFWKNATSINHKETIYFSTTNWIIPPNSNNDIALKEYSGVEDFTLYDADIIYHNGRSVLINDYTAVFFEQDNQFANSVRCTAYLDKKTQNQNYINPTSLTKDLFGNPIFKKRRTKSSHIIIDTNKIHYKLSKYGDILTLTYNNYTHVFFMLQTLTFEEIKSLNDFLHPTFAKTQKIIGASISNMCDWTKLNDDIFEELCYDILYCHPYFDSTTIQKMGKSKSRDGGRDIVVKTKRTPVSEPKVFVFQCKYYSPNSSLSASKINNAANVIMQYGASGYGVFTTAVIDATVYDMLNGFNSSHGINVSYCWSKYELERHLNYNHDIRKKYFPET